MIDLKYYFRPDLIESLKRRFSNVKDFNSANKIAADICGIRDFFPQEEYYLAFLKLFGYQSFSIQDENRREYGDFQTPDVLTNTVCSYLKSHINPKVLVEPTFGKGSFLISALKQFSQLESVFGIEIHERYVWHSKFRILEFFIENPNTNKPSIFLHHADVFDFDWKIVNQGFKGEILVLGNPPWVTNSELSSLNSINIPQKSNFKKHKGFDAITGKGNFDIGEFVVLTMLREFSHLHGNMAMLLKKSVIKNLVYDLKKTNYKISELKSLSFDAKQYFGASVEAALFTCSFNRPSSEYICSAFDFSRPTVIEKTFGWVQDKFISDIELYRINSEFDEISPFEWRQGVKHDNAKVFELKKTGDMYLNGFGEVISVEQERVYGIVKSSDLKGGIINEPRKYVVITQKNLGEETSNLVIKYPKLYTYLCSKKDILAKRKSSIYIDKPEFSIFGIGEYSFKPFKVAISGMYKQPSFTLILPENGKPMMLDDTCYFLGFDKLAHAVFTWLLLKDEHVHGLLRSISFEDAKRPYTKEILMRIALDKLAYTLGFDKIAPKLENLTNRLPANFDYSDWEEFLSTMKSKTAHQSQLALF